LKKNGGLKIQITLSSRRIYIACCERWRKRGGYLPKVVKTGKKTGGAGAKWTIYTNIIVLAQCVLDGLINQKKLFFNHFCL